MERRQNRRIERQIKVVWGSGQSRLCESTTHDLSADGAFISTSRVPAPDSEIEMEFTFHNGYAVRCRGKVVWVNKGQMESFPPGFGVEFVEVDYRIMAFLLELESEEFELS